MFFYCTKSKVYRFKTKLMKLFKSYKYTGEQSLVKFQEVNFFSYSFISLTLIIHVEIEDSWRVNEDECDE